MYAMTILLNLQEDKYKSQIDTCHLFATFGKKIRWLDYTNDISSQMKPYLILAIMYT